MPHTDLSDLRVSMVKELDELVSAGKRLAEGILRSFKRFLQGAYLLQLSRHGEWSLKCHREFDKPFTCCLVLKGFFLDKNIEKVLAGEL